MLMAAKFRALAAERSFVVRLQPGLRGVTRNEVLLSTHVRNPEAVDHVRRNQLEPNDFAHWDVDLVCRHHRVAWIFAVLVMHFPPPLMSDDFETERIRLRRERVDGAAREDVNKKQCEEDDHGRDHAGNDDSRNAFLAFRIWC